jgi:hypothetical protein
LCGNIKIFNIILSYSQSGIESSAGENSEINYAFKGTKMQYFSRKLDFDNDGNQEMIKGILLKEIKYFIPHIVDQLINYLC